MRRMRMGRPEGSKLEIAGRAAGLFAPFKPQLVALIVLIVVTVALNLAPVLLIGEIVNEMGLGADGSGTRIGVLATIMVAMYVASGLLGVLEGYLNQHVGQGVMYNVRSSLHGHLQRLSVRFFTATRTGEILSRITTDVNAMQQAVTGTFTEFLRNFVTLTIAAGIMFMLDWRLAIIVIVVLPLWVYPTVRVGLHQRRLMLEWHEESSKMSANLEETLSVSGSMLVKTFGREEYEAGRFEESNQQLRQLSIRRLIAGRWFNMASSLFGLVSVAVVYWLGGISVTNGSISTGEIVAFAAVTTQVFGPFQMIARINTTMLSSLALFERIFEYLDMPVEVEEAPDAHRLDAPVGAIEFRDVQFRYTDRGAPALDSVSFEASPGQMIALVGPSGAGKTTMTYLMQRYYDPQQGSVRIDGHDVRGLTLDSMSRAIGTVMQETYLFHASLRDNIRYGRLDAEEAEVESAASAAGLDRLVERLAGGLDTVVGERGYRLSGGEKQRVAIARAVLNDPPILILDEATSSLDTKLEREIRGATQELARGRTTVVIAHRLSTVIAADMILVLDQGHVVERGTHEELLALDGLYASLYREQFSDEERMPTPDGVADAVAGGD